MGAWNSNLKLHAAGYLDYQNGLLASREKIGRYWSSSQVNNTLGSSLYFDANSCYIDNSSNKAFGFPLRCLMDTCTITTANAGQGQTVCGDSTTLAGNNPSPDNGLWTILSGSGGYFGNANAYNSSFTGTAGIDYSLLWTITNPPCSDSSSSEVKISFVALPTTANAGPNQSVCGDSTTLAGNYPKIGTGTWTIVDGNIGYFGNANAYNSSFTGTAGIDYSLRWTISNPPCPDSYSDVKIDLVAPPTVANAGPDQSVCGDFTILAGNNPKVGTGQWTIIIGLGGTLGDSSAYNSLFKGRLGTIYTLRWTISNPPCPDSYSDVRVEFSSGLMHLVNAGPNQDVCGNSTTLAANNPNPGYGYWTIVSGTGGHFGNDSAYNSSFSGYEDSTYILRWTVYTPPCPPSYADVRIKFFVPPTIANAGPNQTVCDTSTTLDGNSPIHGTGLWTIVSGSGGHIVNPSLYNSEFYGDTGRTYILHWTISTDSCPPSMDSVTIKFASAPYSYAGPTQTICGNSTTLAGNNPSPGTGKWKVISGSGGILGNDTIYNTAFSGTRGTTYTLTWTVTDINCHRPSTDTVSITFDTPPTTANAGPDQFVHGTTTTLAGNNPYPYSGLWTVLSHSGGTFGNDTAHHSSFTGTAGTIDTLRWTISNGACVSYDDVVISFWGCGDTLIIHHVAGNVAPVTETVTYGTATITKGGSTKCWITQNLGAIHQALSISDTSLAAAGWYWQFDYTQGYTGENYNIIPHSTFACSDTSTTNWKPGNDPCTLLLGSGWRIPDSTEWANEIQGWSNKNDTSGWNSVLKLHPAGGIACEGPDSGLISGRGISGWYWSSTQITGGPTGGNILQFGSTACYMYTSPKPLGNTLRCLKDK